MLEIKRPQAGTGKGFCDGSGRSYNAMYRAAHDFHERHNPPRCDPEFWTATAEDMTETAAKGGNSPFLQALLAAVYSELARESDRLRDQPGTDQMVS